MSRIRIYISLAFGGFFVYTAHAGIRNGSVQLPPPRRYNLFVETPPHDPKFLVATDTHFWTYTSGLYTVGLMLLLFGSIYLVTGDKYLPNMRDNDWFGTVPVAFGLGCWSVVYEVLPTLYS